MQGSPKSQNAGTDLAQLLSRAAELLRQAADVAVHGKLDEALQLEQEADQIRRQARKIATESQKKAAASALLPNQATSDKGLGLRAATIAALGELSVPSSPRTIAEYVSARYGTEIDHRALPSLRRDEARSWSSVKSNRPVYVVPALEGNRFLPVRAKLALSDWALERRLLGPWSERTDHLRATVQVAKQFLWLKKADRMAAERMQTLLAMYAASSFGAALHDKPADPDKVERAAIAELDTIGESDRQWRTEAAARARRFLNEEQMMWGASLPQVVAGRSGD